MINTFTATRRRYIHRVSTAVYAKYFMSCPSDLCVANMTGVGDWAVAFNKARDAVANLTLGEKVGMNLTMMSEHRHIDSVYR